MGKLSPEEQLEILKRGTAEIVSEEELLAKLRKSVKTGKPLRVKLGVDPTAPDIHLGHTVVLRKLKQFQDLGHEVVLLIGDFTGRIGDPTDRSETRKQLSEEEVKRNAATYIEQIGKVLDREKLIVDFNSRWLAPMTFADVVELASKYTVARMLERDDFARRYREGCPLHVHEFFYPLMQGYDSVALEADVELGGTDQKFNLIMARHIQREYGMEPEVAMLTPLIEGTDGVQKMSKSAGNYIGIDEPPEEMFGKTMSIPDELIVRYMTLLTDIPMEEIGSWESGMASGRVNPRDAKLYLAEELVRMYHGAEEARRAREGFIKVFSRGQLPEDMPEVHLDGGTIGLVDLLLKAGFASSKSEARRFIRGGAVRLNGEKVMHQDARVTVEDGAVVQVGKRKFARLRTG